VHIHHLNCGVTEPLGGRLMGGSGHPLRKARGVSHCLLIETEQGLVLVDSGFGLGDIAYPVQRLGKQFLRLARPVLDPLQTAVRQLSALGYAPRDVRHVILTHLDPDHAGGMSDFPAARVHVLESEHRAATAVPTRANRSRARGNQAQWAHGPNWVTYPETGGERWFGFAAVRQLHGLPPDILLVPLPGHTAGHTGVAVQGESPGTPDAKWILHAGDAYFFHGELDTEHAHAPFGIRMFEKRQQVDGRARLDNQARLRELVRLHPGRVEVFSAHDPFELDRYLIPPS
jgi:glyoxylase-like metal-dependent hydrolase (beta-lactamase superfamily II)